MRDAEDRDRPGADPAEGDDWDDGSGDDLEDIIEHADRPLGAESFGTTAQEQEAGEPLDSRLAEERSGRPAVDAQLGLIDEDAEDDESELVAEAVAERDSFVAPEESAMSIRDEAPGGVDHPDDHGVDDEPS